MFRHRGKTRTANHNLQIASLLSFVAGIVNVAGFLYAQHLTTNVTGHFAYLIDEVFKLNFWVGVVYFLYIFSFFFGSFTSNYIIELFSRKSDRNIYVIPVLIECFILFSVAIFGHLFIIENPNVLVFSLLFAMGLQNSLVTSISNSIVRTTHLTGLFTDLGIEFSQLFFYKQKASKKKLYSSIKLRMTIISSFFLGGVLSGICFSTMGIYVLIIAAVILLVGLVFDNIKIRIILLKRKYNNSKIISLKNENN